LHGAKRIQVVGGPNILKSRSKSRIGQFRGKGKKGGAFQKHGNAPHTKQLGEKWQREKNSGSQEDRKMTMQFGTKQTTSPTRKLGADIENFRYKKKNRNIIAPTRSAATKGEPELGKTISTEEHWGKTGRKYSDRVEPVEGPKGAGDGK